MSTDLEQSISSRLRQTLAVLPIGAPIPPSEGLESILGSLEYYIPQLLREIHPEWKHESLDGVFMTQARKTAQLEAELAGNCILISEQTIVPFNLRVQIAPASDELTWLECRLGESQDGRLVRIPYHSGSRNRKRRPNANNIEQWHYAVGFGEKRLNDLSAD
jgi:hypothetical protein